MIQPPFRSRSRKNVFLKFPVSYHVCQLQFSNYDLFFVMILPFGKSSKCNQNFKCLCQFLQATFGHCLLTLRKIYRNGYAFFQLQ